MARSEKEHRMQFDRRNSIFSRIEMVDLAALAVIFIAIIFALGH
jgi:hypothetical protein